LAIISDHEVKVRGVNGGTISSLYQYLVEVNMYKPQLVFLQIGRNAIGNVETTVEKVLLSFEWLFETLQSFSVKCVIVGLLPHREKVLPKRGLTMTRVQ
jgi:lysophospholipase L1-like esterase